MNKLRPSQRSVRWYSQERLKSRSGACSWDRTGEQEKKRNFQNIILGKKQKLPHISKFFCLLLPTLRAQDRLQRIQKQLEQDCSGPHLGKAPLLGKKNRSLSWTEPGLNPTHYQCGIQEKKKDYTICSSQSISNICAHYQQDVFHVKEPLGQKGHLR